VDARAFLEPLSADPDVAGSLVHIREIPSEQLRVIPLDPLVAAGLDDYGFAVSPPWEKAVWSDPESTST